MKGLLIRWLVLTVAIIIASYLLNGIEVNGFFAAFFAAAALGILNALFRPILIILTLPITILTMGFFLLIINAILIKMASGVIDGFSVHGFWTAIFGSIIISISSALINWIIGGRGKVEVINLRNKGGNHWER